MTPDGAAKCFTLASECGKAVCIPVTYWYASQQHFNTPENVMRHAGSVIPRRTLHHGVIHISPWYAQVFNNTLHCKGECRMSTEKGLSRSLPASALRKITALLTRTRVGSEQTCDFCRASIGLADAEVELEGILAGKPLTLHFHQNCYEHWTAFRAALLQVDRAR